MDNITLAIQGRSVTRGFQEHFASVAKINESLLSGAAKSFQQKGLTYVDVPEIVGITGACENIDTLFRIQSRRGIPLFFTQTGQLSLEQALQSFTGVWTIIHSGRDEEEEDERHLRQFRLTEEEFDLTLAGMTRENYDEDKMFEALLEHIQSTIQAMVRHTLFRQGDVLQIVYQRDVKKLDHTASTPFLRIRYEDAIELLQKNGYPAMRFGQDLKAEQEALIVKLLNSSNSELPVFITHYPKEIKFFNMKVSAKDSRVVLSADCVFPYAGEGVGSAVREHDFERLNNRLLTSTMYHIHTERGGTYEDFSWYLDIMKQKKTNPHAGYGIGNERVLQYLFGVSDIRQVSLFALLNSQTGDWEKRTSAVTI